MIITIPCHFSIKLMYYMFVHNKMGVDNFVVLQIGEEIKELIKACINQYSKIDP